MKHNEETMFSKMLNFIGRGQKRVLKECELESIRKGHNVGKYVALIAASAIGMEIERGEGSE